MGLRFLPLLPIENHLEIYKKLILKVRESIDIQKVASIFIAPLIYNKGDFTAIQKKSSLPFLKALQENEEGMMKMNQKYYDEFRDLFTTAFPEKKIFRDYQ